MLTGAGFFDKKETWISHTVNAAAVWDGGPPKDGMDEGSRPNGGRGLNETPAEVIERECPVVIEAFGFVPDTGGPGKYRGGLSIYRR